MVFLRRRSAESMLPIHWRARKKKNAAQQRACALRQRAQPVR